MNKKFRSANIKHTNNMCVVLCVELKHTQLNGASDELDKSLK